MDNLNYGVIGNCCTAALISEKGSIEWLCFPNFDSPSIFAALLDREKGGTFGFEVSEDYHTCLLYTSDAADERSSTPSNRMFPIPIFFPLLLCQNKTNLR